MIYFGMKCYNFVSNEMVHYLNLRDLFVWDSTAEQRQIDRLGLLV